MSAPPELVISPAVETPQEKKRSNAETSLEQLALEPPRTTVIRCPSAERIVLSPKSPEAACCNLIANHPKAGSTKVEQPRSKNNHPSSYKGEEFLDEKQKHSLENLPYMSDKPSVNISANDNSKECADNSSNCSLEEPPASSCNPNFSDDDENAEQLERLKGDAIGDTLYSERFVLSTLLKLSTLDETYVIATDIDGYESDLCSIWDMTLEESVVDFVLTHSALELFAQSIEITTDKRLTEILVGIIGNMCAFENARIELAAHPEVIDTLLELMSCTDSMTLVQLMRVISVVLMNDDPEEVHVTWYKKIVSMPTFVESLTYILQNSVHVDVLNQTLEALNALLAKFLAISCMINSKKIKNLKHSNVFVNEALVLSTIEAFKVLVPHSKRNKKAHAETPADEVTDETLIVSQTVRKTMYIFLSIHVIFAQYNERPMDDREIYLRMLLPCVAQVMEPLCMPQNLLPLTGVVQDVIENVDEIFSAFGDPFDDRVFSKMVTIWDLTHNYAASRLNPSPANDFEKDTYDDGHPSIEEDALTEDIVMTILVFITRIVRHASERQITAVLRTLQPKTILKLIEALSHGETEYDIKQCREKLINGYTSSNIFNVSPKKTPTKHKSPKDSIRSESDDEVASSSKKNKEKIRNS